MELTKIFPIHGTGSPLAARETLLVSMLCQLGYVLYQRNGSRDQANFQDLTDPQTRARMFVFNFATAVEVVYQPDDVSLPVKLAADAIRHRDLTAPKSLLWRAAIYAEYEPGKSPLKALNQHASLVPPEEREQFEQLLDYHEAALREICAMPRHTVVRRSGRTYHLKMGEDIEYQIAALSA